MTANRGALRELPFEHVAEAPSPWRAQIPVPANEVLEPHERRQSHAVGQPCRLDLFQMEHVGSARSFSHPVREFAPRKLAGRAGQASRARRPPTLLGCDVDDLDAEVDGGIARNGKRLPRRNDVHVYAVSPQPAHHSDHASPGRPPLAERRFVDDDQRPQRATRASAVR